MRGMQSGTGKPLSGLEHLQQSVIDILTTRVGSRIMLHEYGSELPELIDKPMNKTGRQLVFAAVATALQRWEPRLRLTQVALERGDAAGAYVLSLTGERRDVPRRSALSAFNQTLNLSAGGGALQAA